MTTTYVSDIEANNLLPGITKIHCTGLVDVDTGEEFFYRPHEQQAYRDRMDTADKVVFHNAFGYDVAAMFKVWGYTPKCTVICTKVMSQVLNYRRFGFGHSLKLFGQSFEKSRIESERLNLRGGITERKEYVKLSKQKESLLKGDYSGGFETFNEEMFEYMKQDIRLGVKVYKFLMQELRNYIKASGSKTILKALRSEMEMDAIMVKQNLNGWKFDLNGAKMLVKVVEDQMVEMQDFINPMLSGNTIVVDPDTQRKHEEVTGKRYAVPKKPTYTKAGKLVKTTVNWFKLPLDTDVNSSPIWGSYCRVDFTVGDIGNTDTVKGLITSLGWKPDEWNWKKIDGKLTKTSAKLSDSSLEPLGEVGAALMKYYTLRSRHSIIKGWFEHVDKESRLHGDVFNIGTPTFRQTHKIIANLPSGGATLGKEIRELFVAKKGYKIVSADSAACQLRLLAHYMKDADYLDLILNGDVHQRNADILGCTRSQAKRFIFAFLYGAGPQKLSSYIGKSLAETKKSIKAFKKALPKLTALIERITSIVEEGSAITGLDDRPIMLPIKECYKALNYLIQGAEAVVMKATVVMIDKRLTESKIDFSHLLFYHDEHSVEVREDQAEEARDIIMQCFIDAPKEYGVDIMTCGDCKIGDNYFEVH